MIESEIFVQWSCHFISFFLPIISFWGMILCSQATPATSSTEAEFLQLRGAWWWGGADWESLEDEFSARKMDKWWQMWWNAMIFIEFPPFLVRCNVAALRLEAPPQATATVSMVNRTATCRVQMPFEEGKTHLAGRGMLQLTSNCPRCWSQMEVILFAFQCVVVHPLGILLNYKCSCQWNYLLNGWPYIGSVFCVFGLFSIPLKTEHWLLVWQILKRLQLWPQRMRRRIPNRTPMSAFIAESFKATRFDV